MKKITIVIWVLFAASIVWGDSFKYEPRGKRDPFVPLIGQDKNVIAALADVTSVEDLKLEGIAVGAKNKKTAIINGEIVKEGQRAGSIEIKKIAAGSVELLMGGKPHILKLSEEGGFKSDQ